MKKVLLLENIHQNAVDNFKKNNYNVELLDRALSEDELVERLSKDVHILGLRSKTKLTQKVLESAKHLEHVGCFCIGTNQVNLSSAKHIGVPVFNAPHSNTRSVAELVIAHMINLARQVADRSAKCHQGVWDKSAKGNNEIRNKKIGIVGYGHIGSQVSVLAESMGMNVLFYDITKKLPLGNAKSVSSIEELLEESDFVTLHVPGLPSTVDLIGEKELKLMKKSAYLINYSRGNVVVIDDLVKALKSKLISGCAVDVFPVEPASNADTFSSPLCGLDNVILTPHIGGSTEEAQKNIAIEVSEALITSDQVGVTLGSVNFPSLSARRTPDTLRVVNAHKNKPGVLGEINKIISESGVNIESQHLATDSEIGYLTIDIKIDDAKELIGKFEGLESSIRTRLIQ